MTDDATALAAAIRAGNLSATEAMQASFQAAEFHHALGAIVHLDREMGESAARAMDREREIAPYIFEARPFAGVPVLAKDLGGPFAGLPVAAGLKRPYNVQVPCSRRGRHDRGRRGTHHLHRFRG